jgi:hypothetical protein
VGRLLIPPKTVEAETCCLEADARSSPRRTNRLCL